MPTKDPLKKAEANRERQKRYRERHKTGVTPSQNNAITAPKVEKITQGVTQAEIDNLPPSLKFQIEQGTKVRQTLHIPLEIKERTEMAVRRFRGY